jgi:GTP cyclohydrolase I
LPGVDEAGVRRAVEDLLAAIGVDAEREGLRDTPRRVAAMYKELFSGLGRDPREVLSVTFDEGHDEMVVVKDIPFYSTCEHHLIPFHGKAHVAYIPAGRIVGLSKLVRAVEILARRPQVQERLTCQLADAICDALKPQGAAVVIEAEHLCMSMRGIKKPGTLAVTSAMRGVFASCAATRAEFFAIIRGHSLAG